MPVVLRKTGNQPQDQLDIQAVNDTIVIRPIQDVLELERFRGKVLPLQEQRTAMPR